LGRRSVQLRLRELRTAARLRRVGVREVRRRRRRDVHARGTRNERIRPGGRRRLPHVLLVRAWSRRSLGHVSVARPRAARTERNGGVVAAPRRVLELISDIPGWLTDEEAEALYELARRCRGDGVIVEIGSWKGKSTVCLGIGSQEGNAVPIYAIDPHADYRFGGFKTNVHRVGIADLVRPIACL